jgi:threonylcarbamoyladenosine tRNA methylthiotransferase CDKAL1
MTPFMAHQFSDTLIKILNHPNIYSFLHLPIQSGSDRILALMRRKEKQITFLELIEQLRAKVPELILSTDIIVGFPGESEQDYEETRNMIEKIRFNIVNISKYTDRPDTEASRMTDKVPTKIKSRRSRELTKITHKITKTMLKEWIGWEGKVLIDEYGKKPNQFMGRNTSYLPILFENAEVALGDFINARIVDSKAIYLVGEVLNKIK